MSKVTFSKLNMKMKMKDEYITIYLNPELDEELKVEVRQYLPIEQKAALITFVAENAIDEKTGCFSEIRIETYFALAIAKYYAGITFTDKQIENAAKIYDVLESNGVFTRIMSAIPESEFNFLTNAVSKTIADIARFNNSFAGMLNMISDNAGGMDEQFTEILEKIKNGEGLETLSEIKNIVG